ncbi:MULTISPECIES: hypothetical protein [unclassified Microbacterium]|uniref:hypothetical protein n=1 Tax=unclassified Microbacterium TaxID=2609290 RepID=UPI003019E9D0
MRLRAIDLVDILMYLIVLGTFTQLFPAVISETFLLSLLTAVLLKIVLEAVAWAKKQALARIRSDAGVVRRAVGVVMLVLIMPGSKFVVLELVALVFGDAVKLGGFFLVTLLIVVLMLARGAARRLLNTAESQS